MGVPIFARVRGAREIYWTAIREKGRGGIFRGEDDELSRGSPLSAANFRERLR